MGAHEHQLIAYVLQTQAHGVAEELQWRRRGKVPDLCTTVICRHPSPRFAIKARQRSHRQGSAKSLARRDRALVATGADRQVAQTKTGDIPQSPLSSTGLSSEVPVTIVKQSGAVDTALDSPTTVQTLFPWRRDRGRQTRPR